MDSYDPEARGQHDDELEAKLSEWFATNWGDGVMIGFALVVVGVKPDEPGRHAYSTLVPEDQAVHSTLGLTDYLHREVRGLPNATE